MENQDYNSFYSNFEEKYKNDFYSVFASDEDLRLKILKEYKVRKFLFFILLPLAITVILAIMFFYSFPLFIGVFFGLAIAFCIAAYCTVFNTNSYVTIIPIFLLIILYILKISWLTYLVVLLICFTSVIAVYLKYFFEYRDMCNKKYTDVLKRKYMNKLTKMFGNIKYFCEGGCAISLNDLKQSSLFMDFSTIEVDDEYRGVYKGVPFSISEAKLYDESKHTSRGYHKDKIFQGVIINFEINKIVKNRTLVSTKHNKTSQNVPIIAWISLFVLSYFIWYGCGILGKILLVIFDLYVIGYSIFVKDEKFEKIVLEDEKFNKIFNAYYSDQIEARYLLTTSFMDRFKNIQTTFGARIVKCSFYDENKLMIAISTNKNLFEIGSLFKSVYDKDLMKQFYKELSSIYFLIDYFKLDENTGL